METKIIHAEIISPLCIWNGKDRTGLDFFINGNSIYIIDQNRIESALENYSNETNDLLKAISNGNGKRIDEIKNNLGIDFFQDFIKYQFNLGESAKKTLSQGGNSNNQGIIKQQYSELFDNNKLLIPGSTLKGIFRTAYLYSLISGEIKLENIQLNTKFKGKPDKKNPINIKNLGDVANIETLDKDGKLNDDLFKWIACSDTEIENGEVVIQTFQSKNKPLKNGAVKKGVSLTVESVVNGECNFEITELPNQKNINLSDFEGLIKIYSKCMIDREEKLINNIGYKTDFVKTLRDYRKDGKYPIKLGMYKKSLTYKLRWDEIANALKNLKKGNEWLDFSRVLGIGDKTLYIDEEGNPVGRIVLSFD